MVYASLFSHPDRWGDTLLPETFATLRRALPASRIGLCDCFIGGLSYYPYDALAVLKDHPEVDFALTHETEVTAERFLRRIRRGDVDFGDIPGLTWRGPDGPVANPPHGPDDRIADLDALPWPAFDLLDMDAFFEVQRHAFRADLIHEYPEPRRILPLITSRGCRFRCMFCQHSTMPVPWRAHSAAYLEALVRGMRERYRPDLLFFLDDNLSIDADRFDRLTSFLAGERMAWDAVNGLRADTLADRHLERMAAAGCPKLTTSGESGDDRVMTRIIGKGLRPAVIDRLAEAAGRAGLPLQVHWVVGLPGESRREVNTTLVKATRLLEAHRAHPLVMHAVPSPGTKLLRQCLDEGLLVGPESRLQDEYGTYRIRTPELGPGFIGRAMANLSRMVRNRTFLPRFPVSDRSNNDWIHREYRVLPPPPRDDAEADRRLSWLARARGRGVVFCGDEPTTERRLIRWIALAAARGLRRTWLRTNGRLFSYPGTAARFAGAGLHGVAVEFPADDARIFERVSGVPGSHAETLAGIESLLREGVEVVLVTTVLASTLEALPSVVALAARTGIRALFVCKPKPFSRRRDVIPEIPDHASFLDALSRLEPASSSPAVYLVGVPACIVPGWTDRVRNELDLFAREDADLKEVTEACLRCPDAVSCRFPWNPDLDRLYRERDLLPRDPDRVL
jgi:hypothetical protein